MSRISKLKAYFRQRKGGAIPQNLVWPVQFKGVDDFILSNSIDALNELILAAETEQGRASSPQLSNKLPEAVLSLACLSVPY
jgi:hypothetical protein